MSCGEGVGTNTVTSCFFWMMPQFSMPSLSYLKDVFGILAKYFFLEEEHFRTVLLSG